MVEFNVHRAAFAAYLLVSLYDTTPYARPSLKRAVLTNAQVPEPVADAFLKLTPQQLEELIDEKGRLILEDALNRTAPTYEGFEAALLEGLS